MRDWYCNATYCRDGGITAGDNGTLRRPRWANIPANTGRNFKSSLDTFSMRIVMAATKTPSLDILISSFSSAMGRTSSTILCPRRTISTTLPPRSNPRFCNSEYADWRIDLDRIQGSFRGGLLMGNNGNQCVGVSSPHRSSVIRPETFPESKYSWELGDVESSSVAIYAAIYPRSFSFDIKSSVSCWLTCLMHCGTVSSVSISKAATSTIPFGRLIPNPCRTLVYIVRGRLTSHRIGNVCRGIKFPVSPTYTRKSPSTLTIYALSCPLARRTQKSSASPCTTLTLNLYFRDNRARVCWHTSTTKGGAMYFVDFFVDWRKWSFNKDWYLLARSSRFRWGNPPSKIKVLSRLEDV